MSQSVVVAGAGVIGCAIARELALRGVRCTVVDPRSPGGGATQASAGMLAPYVEAHAGGPMLDLCVRSLDAYDGWVEGLRREGARLEYRRMPTLRIALSDEDAGTLRTGYGDWLPPGEIARLLPDLLPTAGALRNDRHGYVDARQLVRALADSAARHGAAFVEGRVERVSRSGGTRVIDLGPSREAIHADAVVLAAGAWSNRIHGVRTPPLGPVRGQLLVHDGVLENVPRPSPLPAILWGPGCYIVPREASPGLLIGATVEDAGFDEQPTAAARASLLTQARALLPLSDGGVTATRVGLRPATPDDLPVLGDDPTDPGIFHASGHYRNGVLLAPITARTIADLIVDGVRDAALSHFSVTRFD